MSDEAEDNPDIPDEPRSLFAPEPESPWNDDGRPDPRLFSDPVFPFEAGDSLSVDWDIDPLSEARWSPKPCDEVSAGSSVLELNREELVDSVCPL